MSETEKIKCGDCKYKAVDWVSSTAGIGMYRLSLCRENPCDVKVVDADIERVCPAMRPLEAVTLTGKEQ